MARTRSTLAAAMLIPGLLLAGCAGGTPSTSEPADAPATSDSAPAASDPASPAATGSAAATILFAVVGSADDPEAYVIGILDEDGAAVTSVPAGDYSLTYVDRSQMHNFHLTGSGVDVATDVRGTDETTVEITLAAGTYTYVCDPHAGTMRGELTVTG